MVSLCFYYLMDQLRHFPYDIIIAFKIIKLVDIRIKNDFSLWFLYKIPCSLISDYNYMSTGKINEV